MSDDYFSPNKVCPTNKMYLYHSTIIIVRCDLYKLLNLNYVPPSVNLPERERANPFINREVIEIKKSLTNLKPALPQSISLI
jgi:hypothetical protein